MMRALILVLALGAAGSVRAQSLPDLYRSGNEAFARGQFADAQKHYQRLVEAGIRDPDVYVNLGLAQARAGALGAAILSFERALRLRPDDADAASALAQARAATGKRRADEQGEALVETRPPLAEALVRPYRENTLALLSLAFNVILFGCLWIRRLARNDSVLTGLAIGAAVAALGLGVSLSALLVKRGAHQDGQAAVVLRDGAELREAPDPRAATRGQAQEGGGAQVLAQDSGFARVRTKTGATGWMANEDVGIIAD